MIAGLDTNVICYALDEEYPEHDKARNFLLDLSPENRIAVNPTIIHEAYHVLVFSQKWKAQDVAYALKIILKNPFVEFFNQTRKISGIALSLSVRHNLGGRDALIIANFLANQTPIMYTADRELLRLQKIVWKGNSLTFRDSKE